VSPEATMEIINLNTAIESRKKFTLSLIKDKGIKGRGKNQNEDKCPLPSCNTDKTRKHFTLSKLCRLHLAEVFLYKVSYFFH